MNKQQQIDEIAECVLGGTTEYRLQVAELIYNKGYRKQSEGEWVVKAYPVDSDEVVILPYEEHQHNEPFCSICNAYALLNGGEEYVISNYCPNCGAKMKGGAE